MARPGSRPRRRGVLIGGLRVRTLLERVLTRGPGITTPRCRVVIRGARVRTLLERVLTAAPRVTPPRRRVLIAAARNTTAPPPVLTPGGAQAAELPEAKRQQLGNAGGVTGGRSQRLVYLFRERRALSRLPQRAEHQRAERLVEKS